MHNTRGPIPLATPNHRQRTEMPLTAIWVIHCIVSDIDGTSIELAFRRNVRNVTRDL